MPWKETCTMNERELFINAWLERVTSVTNLRKGAGGIKISKSGDAMTP